MSNLFLIADQVHVLSRSVSCFRGHDLHHLLAKQKGRICALSPAFSISTDRWHNLPTASSAIGKIDSRKLHKHTHIGSHTQMPSIHSKQELRVLNVQACANGALYAYCKTSDNNYATIRRRAYVVQQENRSGPFQATVKSFERVRT